MARDENPPFPLGTTFFGGDSAVINATDGYQMEGAEYTFEDIVLTNGTIGADASRSNKRRLCRIVRNVNASALLPATLGKLSLIGTSVNNMQGQVNGLCATAADKGYPVDEWLPSAGCVQNDLCWVVIDGLATVTTSGSGTTTLVVGQVAVPGASGGVVAQDATTTGADLFNQIQNAVGRACAAVAANSTKFVIAVGARP
jgi:hypothetical protein